MIQYKKDSITICYPQNDELNRFHQPVGKQYTYGKGMKQLSEVEQLRLQVELLKKYQSLVRESTK